MGNRDSENMYLTPSWTKKNFLLLILMSIAFVSSGQFESFDSKMNNPKCPCTYLSLVTSTLSDNKTILLTCLLLQKKIVVTFANSLHFLWFYNTVIYKSTIFQILQVQRSKGQPAHLKVTTQANSSQNPKSCEWRYLVNSFIAAPAFDSSAKLTPWSVVSLTPFHYKLWSWKSMQFSFR